MGNLNIKFIDNNYSIPEDVLLYIDLLKITDNIKEQLVRSFVRLVTRSESGLIDDSDMTSYINSQTNRFITMLCDNGIYDRTVSDYLRNNKGYKLFSDVNEAGLNKIKALLMQRLDDMQSGVETALYKKESSVTGMGFSIWSSSFVNHAIYAAMQASTINKQEKAANQEYQREINALCSKLESNYDRDRSSYIKNEYIPNMETAFTLLAYEMLDKYVSDLISNGKFDSIALSFVDMNRSNELLENLKLSDNKKAILEKAFLACPYNAAVYMAAMRYDLLDTDSFQTAKIFKCDDTIISFLGSHWGEVSYPNKFDINYPCIELLALYLNKSSKDILHNYTEHYATQVIRAYSNIAHMCTNEDLCFAAMRKLSDGELLSGKGVSVGVAQANVHKIVSDSVWNQLTINCGHPNLLDKIKAAISEMYSVQEKAELDNYLIEKLTTTLEKERLTIVEKIKEKRKSDAELKAKQEQLRIEQEKQKAELERIRQEKKAKIKIAVKKGAKRIPLVIGAIVAMCIVLVIVGIIFLFATDKSIDNDFSERTEYSLHSLTYFIPDNWEEDYEYNQSNENTKIYVRYNNLGKFVCMISVIYHGDTQQISVEDVTSKYTFEHKDATTKRKQIGEQEFTVISYVRTDDYNSCNIYVTERESSVFEIYFRAIPKSTNHVLFDEIVEAIAFDDYVNPKESTYNEAVDLMSAEKYDEAISVFETIVEYRDSKNKIKECNKVLLDNEYNKAVSLINKGEFEPAYDILVKLNNHPDAVDMLKNFIWVPKESTYVPAKSSESDAHHEYIYNDIGVLIKEIINDSTVVTYSYNTNDDLTLKKYTYSDGDTAQYEYKYNSKNQLVQEKYTYPDGGVDIINYTYNSSGRISEAEDIHWDDFNQHITYSYDTDGNLVKKDTIDHFGSLGCYEYEYDENGHLIKEIHTTDIDKSYSVVYTTEYSYSTKGYLIEVSEYKDDEEIGCKIFEDWIVFYS